MLTVILASASPRRSTLLEQVNIPHIVLPANISEDSALRSPANLVADLARQKASFVYKQYVDAHPTEDFVIIGADTAVSLGHKILGKPATKDDALNMLMELQGKTHQVYTGVCLIKYKHGIRRLVSFYESSHVSVAPMTQEEILDYIDTGEPFDKAGGYGIQGPFAAYIHRIEGDYNNIVGLPLARLYLELKKP